MRRFVSGLILGAGASSRLGQPKQLLPFKGTTLLGWVVAQVEACRALDEVVVVLGGAADDVKKTLRLGRAKVVENPTFGQGCASSYRVGIGALDPRTEGLVIILGDQPDVNAGIIDRVVEAWRREGNKIVLASYQGRRGHPMLFSKALFVELLGLHGDKAAWKLVDANLEWVREVEMARPAPVDIDTWQDYERLRLARQD